MEGLKEVKEMKEVMMTKKRFQTMVEDTVRQFKLTYLDAILMICEKNNIEIEDVSKYVTPPIKDKLEADATRLSFLKGSNNYKPLE